MYSVQYVTLIQFYFSAVARGGAGGVCGPSSLFTPKVTTDMYVLKIKSHHSVVLHNFPLNNLYLITRFVLIVLGLDKVARHHCSQGFFS